MSSSRAGADPLVVPLLKAEGRRFANKRLSSSSGTSCLRGLMVSPGLAAVSCLGSVYTKSRTRPCREAAHTLATGLTVARTDSAASLCVRCLSQFHQNARRMDRLSDGFRN